MNFCMSYRSSYTLHKTVPTNKLFLCHTQRDLGVFLQNQGTIYWTTLESSDLRSLRTVIHDKYFLGDKDHKKRK